MPGNLHEGEDSLSFVQSQISGLGRQSLTHHQVSIGDNSEPAALAVAWQSLRFLDPKEQAAEPGRFRPTYKGGPRAPQKLGHNLSGSSGAQLVDGHPGLSVRIQRV